MERVIDWTLASQVARGVARLQPAGDPAPFEALEGPSEESERLVSAYTGLVPAAPLPVAEAVGRDEWADANLASLRGVLDPVADRLGDGLRPARRHRRHRPQRPAGRRGGRDLGLPRRPRARPVRVPRARPRRARRGCCSWRPTSATPPATLDAEPDQLLRWVALHETTHALQFGAVPWLRGHLADSVRELLGGLSFEGGSLLKIPDLADLRGLVDSVREDGIADAGARAGAARAVRPHAGADGRAGGLRRARDGRRRRRRARRPRLACAARSTAAGASARASCACSSA